MTKFHSYFAFVPLILWLLASTVGYGQNTYLTTSTVLNGGNGSSGVSFNLSTNKNITITDIQGAFYGTTSTTVELWYNTTPVNGAPSITTTNGWVSLGTATLTPANTGTTGTAVLQSTVPTQLFMPAGSTWGFFVSGTNCVYTTMTGTLPNTVSDATITATVGGTAAYGGPAPNPTFNPRGFNGAIGYLIASGGINDASTTNIFAKSGCPGVDSVFADITNFGINRIDSVTVNWSVNGTIQTPINFVGLLDTFSGVNSPTQTVGLGLFSSTSGVTDTIEVWTTLPNGLIDTTTDNDSAIVFLKPALQSGTYTIGGVSPDYPDFTSAVADLNSVGICGPVVFNVRQGTYNEQFEFLNVQGTSSTNTILFHPDPANTGPIAVNYAASLAADNYVIKLSGVDYLTIDSIEVEATGTTQAYGIVLGTANFFTLKNCKVTSNLASTSFNAVPLYNSSGNGIDNALIENNSFYGGYYGVYWYGSGITSKEVGNTLRNNRILEFRLYGLMSYYQGDNVIENNYIEQSTAATSSSYGIYIFYNDSVKVLANRVILNGPLTNYGMYVFRAEGSATNKVEIYNNMIVTAPNSTGTTYAAYLNTGKHINFYHNSINTRGVGTTNYALYVLGGAATVYENIAIRNNIFANSGLGQAAYLNSTAANVAVLTMDNNIFTAASGTSPLNLNGTSHTLTSWTAATLLDSNSLDALPGFFSQTDLHLQGGVAADAGANLGVMVDIDGDARPLLPSTGYDIGADEYIPPTCPMGYGLTAFNLTANSAEVTWVAGTSDSAWIFEYGSPGFTPGTGTSISSANDTVLISGLTAVTDYDVYVRGLCGIGDTSQYFGPFQFKTRCVSSLAGVYTINSALPTAGTNYTNFADVINALNTCGVSGPTTFNVKQGTYNEQMKLGSIIGSTPINTITFVGDPTNTSPAILSFGATSSLNNYVVSFDNAEHIVLDNLELRATGLSFAHVIDFPTSANFISIMNCEMTGASSTSADAYIVNNELGVTNLANNVTFDNNTFINGSYSIYWRGGSLLAPEKNVVFTNNKLQTFLSYGAYFYFQDSAVINGNEIIQSNLSTSFGYGLYTYYMVDASVKGNKIEMNSTTTNYGMIAGYYSGTNNEVSNNMIVTSGSGTGTAFGLYLNYILNTNVYHNSVNIRAGSATATRALYVLSSTFGTYGNVDIRNNIFANNAGGHASYFNAAAIAVGQTSLMDHNVYFSSGSAPFFYGNTDYFTLQDYQSASGFDANSYLSSPGFTSMSDLHNVGSVAYDNGDATVGVMTDFDGDTRPLAPSTGYDIGADEYVLPSCPGSYSLRFVDATTTSSRVTWTSGLSDVSWQLQYGPEGFAPGTGTVISTSADTATIPMLNPSSCYNVWIRSICSAGDTSIWTGPVRFCTACGPVTDICENFEAYNQGSLPICWERFISTTGTSSVAVSNFGGNASPKSISMNAGNDATATLMLISPEFSSLSSGTHRAVFWLDGSFTPDTTMVIGTMSDPTNPGTFTPWDTINDVSASYKQYTILFDTYTGTDTRIAFLFNPTATFRTMNIDDFCFEAIPSCEKPPAVDLLSAGIDSTSMDIGWNIDATHVSYFIAYGPAGYNPMNNTANGDTVTAQFNFKTVTGLEPLTEYCFWVKAVCANGDTSAWEGPHCGPTGCPSGTPLPYAEDFTTYRSLFPVDETPLCWTEATGGLSTIGGVTVAESNWEPDGFSNSGGTGAARFNFPTFGTREGWLITPTFDFGSDPNKARIIEFDVSLTAQFNSNPAINGFGSDDTVAFVVSYDQGQTWRKSNILVLWDTANEPTNIGNRVIYTMRNTSGLVKFGFFAKSSLANEGVEFFVDNFSIRDTTWVGIEENSVQRNEFQVYPNPSAGVFNVLNSGMTKTSSLKLIDIQGRMVYDNRVTFSQNGIKQINVETLKSGVYVLLIQNENGQEQHRLVIQ